MPAYVRGRDELSGGEVRRDQREDFRRQAIDSSEGNHRRVHGRNYTLRVRFNNFELW